jgi:FKBP-type peptidyl-prolyl cis-trans isomerase 2
LNHSLIVDLTRSRPNVFYEAGYAQGLRKTPIYLAREGTHLEFDLKDYPVIFFRGMKELKDNLEKRLRGLEEGEKTSKHLLKPKKS